MMAWCRFQLWRGRRKRGKGAEHGKEAQKKRGKAQKKSQDKTPKSSRKDPKKLAEGVEA